MYNNNNNILKRERIFMATSMNINATLSPSGGCAMFKYDIGGECSSSSVTFTTASTGSNIVYRNYESLGILKVSMPDTMGVSDRDFEITSHIGNKDCGVITVHQPVCDCATFDYNISSFIPTSGYNVGDILGTITGNCPRNKYIISSTSNTIYCDVVDTGDVHVKNLVLNRAIPPNLSETNRIFHNLKIGIDDNTLSQSECADLTLRQLCPQDVCDCSRAYAMLTMLKATFSPAGTSERIMFASGSTYCGYCVLRNDHSLADTIFENGQVYMTYSGNPGDFQCWAKALPNTGGITKANGLSLDIYDDNGTLVGSGCSLPSHIYQDPSYCSCDNSLYNNALYRYYQRQYERHGRDRWDTNYSFGLFDGYNEPWDWDERPDFDGTTWHSAHCESIGDGYACYFDGSYGSYVEYADGSVATYMHLSYFCGSCYDERLPLSLDKYGYSTSCGGLSCSYYLVEYDPTYVEFNGTIGVNYNSFEEEPGKVYFDANLTDYYVPFSIKQNALQVSATTRVKLTQLIDVKTIVEGGRVVDIGTKYLCSVPLIVDITGVEVTCQTMKGFVIPYVFDYEFMYTEYFHDRSYVIDRCKNGETFEIPLAVPTVLICNNTSCNYTLRVGSASIQAHALAEDSVYCDNDGTWWFSGRTEAGGCLDVADETEDEYSIDFILPNGKNCGTLYRIHVIVPSTDRCCKPTTKSVYYGDSTLAEPLYINFDTFFDYDCCFGSANNLVTGGSNATIDCDHMYGNPNNNCSGITVHLNSFAYTTVTLEFDAWSSCYSHPVMLCEGKQVTLTIIPYTPGGGGGGGGDTKCDYCDGSVFAPATSPIDFSAPTVIISASQYAGQTLTLGTFPINSDTRYSCLIRYVSNPNDTYVDIIGKGSEEDPITPSDSGDVKVKFKGAPPSSNGVNLDFVCAVKSPTDGQCSYKIVYVKYIP